MAAIQDFILRIKTEGQEKIKQMNDQVKGLGTSFNQVNQQLATQFGNLDGILQGVVGRFGAVGLAAAAVATALGGLARQGIRLGDELGDLSDATDISAGSLLNLRNSIIEAGGKGEDFATVAAKLNQSVQDAAGGNEQLQKAFQKLGVFVTDASGNIRSTEAILRDLTARFREGRLSGEEYSAAIEILGRQINKLDLTKLNATGDAVTDKQIAEITRMTGEIDKLKASFDRLAITIAGNLSEAINRAVDAVNRNEREFQERERKLNLEGRTGLTAPMPGELPSSSSRLPFGMSRRMTAAEQEAFRIRELERANEAYQPTRQAGAPGVAGGGGFGATPEAQLKAEAEFRKRLQESQSAAATAIYLQGKERELQIARETGNELQRLEAERDFAIARLSVQASDDIAKARLQIFTQERLTEEQKNQEFAAKSVEIEQKANLQRIQEENKTQNAIRKIIADRQRATFQAEEEQREQNRRDLAAEEDLRRQQLMGIYENIDALQTSRQENQRRFELEKEIGTLTSGEQANRRQLLELDIQRQKAISDLTRLTSLSAEDRAQAEERINNEYEKTVENLRSQQAQIQSLQNTFAFGWEKAFNEYAERANDTAGQVAQTFQTMTSGLEDAFVKFAQTGKLEFEDMANAIIADLIRIAVRRAVVFAGSSLFGFPIPGMAKGGPVFPDKPYIVGEQGPELFIPKSAGDIVPNNSLQGGTGGGEIGQSNVTYNINAVDAASFRALVARDPAFIYTVTEQGRRSQPMRTR